MTGKTGPLTACSVSVSSLRLLRHFAAAILFLSLRIFLLSSSSLEGYKINHKKKAIFWGVINDHSVRFLQTSAFGSRSPPSDLPTFAQCGEGCAEKEGSGWLSASPPPFQRARELRNGAMIASENRCVARCSSSTRILSPIATRRRPRCTDQRSLPGLSSPSSRRCAPSSGLWLVHLRGRENGWRRWWWSAPSTSDRETWRSRSPSEQRSHSSRGPVERNRCKC